MLKKTIFGVAVATLAALLMAPSAFALCSGPTTANTYNSVSGGFTYFNSPSGNDNVSTLIGRAWQLGAPGTFDSAGTIDCNPSSLPPGPGLLYWSANPPGQGVGVGADFSTCGSGCPSATLALFASIAKANVTEVLFDSAPVSTAAGPNYDFSTHTGHSFVPLHLTVNSSGPRAANSMPISVSVPSVAAGIFASNATVSGYRVVSALSVTDPGPNASAYAPVAGGALTASGGAAAGPTPLTLDCTDPTNTKDQWVAVQLTFEGGTLFAPSVSARRRVHCAGALADPHYRPVPRGKALGTQK